MDIIKRFKRTRSIASTLQREEGLTLIEALAVVVILGIVASIAVPSVTKAINEAKINATETTLGTLQSALSRYYFDQGQYPSTLTALTTDTGLGTGQSSWQGPYIKGPFPMNDAWGNPIDYGYVTNSSGSITGYVLVSGDGHVVAVEKNVFSWPNASGENSYYLIAAGGDNGVQSNGSSYTSFALNPTSIDFGSSSSTEETARTIVHDANIATSGTGTTGTFTDN